MAVPNIFGSATSAIPLSQLDQNFATAITLGNTAVYLGNTTTSLGNVTLTNVTISSGNVTVSAGSNTSPSITTVGDTNTGIYFPAADTIGFTEGGVEAMRIDSSGNVGIGTVSPTVSGVEISRATGSATPTPVELRLATTTSASDWSTTDPWGRLSFYSADTSVSGPKIISTIDTIAYATNGGASNISFKNTNLSGVLQECMRIDTSGNVGIGETSPTNTLDVKAALGRIKLTSSTGTNSALVLFNNTGGNAYVGLDNSAGSLTSAYALNLYHEGAYPIIFSTNNTRRATIDSSGNLLVGTTSSDPTVVGARINTSATIPQISVAVTTTSNNYLLYNTTAAAYRFFVTSAGVINATTTTITPISSDARLKQDIVDYDKGLAEVLALRPRYFAYKNAPDRKLSGFISQEVQTVIPEAIQPTFEDPEMLTYSIDWYSLLVKAMQEQQAIITQLQADVAALKGTA